MTYIPVIGMTAALIGIQTATQSEPAIPTAALRIPGQPRPLPSRLLTAPQALHPEPSISLWKYTLT